MKHLAVGKSLCRAVINVETARVSNAYVSTAAGSTWNHMRARLVMPSTYSMRAPAKPVVSPTWIISKYTTTPPTRFAEQMALTSALDASSGQAWGGADVGMGGRGTGSRRTTTTWPGRTQCRPGRRGWGGMGSHSSSAVSSTGTRNVCVNSVTSALTCNPIRSPHGTGTMPVRGSVPCHSTPMTVLVSSAVVLGVCEWQHHGFVQPGIRARARVTVSFYAVPANKRRTVHRRRAAVRVWRSAHAGVPVIWCGSRWAADGVAIHRVRLRLDCPIPVHIYGHIVAAG